MPSTDWVRVTCGRCDRVIAGYPEGAQPRYLEIHHNCDPTSNTYQVTMVRG